MTSSQKVNWEAKAIDRKHEEFIGIFGSVHIRTGNDLEERNSNKRRGHLGRVASLGNTAELLSPILRPA